MTCTKTEPKNDLFLNCRRKTKELSKKELSNVAPALATTFTKSQIYWLIGFHSRYFRFETTVLSISSNETDWFKKTSVKSSQEKLAIDNDTLWEKKQKKTLDEIVGSDKAVTTRCEQEA